MRVSMRPWPFSTVVLVASSLSGASPKYLSTSPSSRLIALEAEQIVGLVCHDLVGDGDLAAHRIDGDERAFELLGLGELVEQIGDRGDLIGLFRDRELRQCQTGIGGVG